MLGRRSQIVILGMVPKGVGRAVEIALRADG
jgi:hypothetical protein